MKSQTYAMTAAARLAACALLIVGAVATALLLAPRASAQQNCVQVRMISAEAWFTLYMIDGGGNRLRDIGSGNTLSNRQVGSSIVLRGMPSSIGVYIQDTGGTSYNYRSSVVQSGDRGYEDGEDTDYNDAVILITSVSCSAQGRPPQQVYIPPPGSDPTQSDPSETDLATRAPVVSSVSADSITATSARAVVAISDHDGSELSVKLRYQQKAETQDWTTDAVSAEATGSASPATKQLQGLSPGTEYVLQASLDDAFPDDGTKETAFTTLPLPSIQSVSVGNIGQTSARATVSIANPDGSAQTVKLQYRTASPQSQWSRLEASSTTASATLDLTGLTADTGYELQAWLASDEAEQGDGHVHNFAASPAAAAEIAGGAGAERIAGELHQYNADLGGSQRELEARRRGGEDRAAAVPRKRRRRMERADDRHD